METLLGLDLGTSSFKATAYAVDGTGLGVVSCPTPWRQTAAGLEMAPAGFSRALRALVEQCAQQHAAGPVVGVGVTGMAETMFIETTDGRTLVARAWNYRGHRAPTPPEAFARTGLLDTARTPLVELRRVADDGAEVRGWSGLPEYAVRVLGGDRVAERSLAARTGMVDVVAGRWDPELLAWAGVTHVDLPQLLPAGSAGGRVLDGTCAGAVLTVAGHDHVTAAIGADAHDRRTVFDSLGTGEAVIAQVAGNGERIEPSALERYNAAGYNVSLGVDDDDTIAFAGLGTGNRYNLLLGALDEAGFARADVLDPAAHPAPDEHDALLAGLPGWAADLLDRLFGPDWQDLRAAGSAGGLTGQVQDLDQARALWWAAVVRSGRVTRAALDELDRLYPHVTRVVAAGGWLANAGVRAVREVAVGPFTVPDVDQCGARGAALLAGLAAGAYRSRDDFPTMTPTEE